MNELGKKLSFLAKGASNFENPFDNNGPNESADTEPEDEKLAQKWRIYRSCKTCFDFIQTHFNP